MSSPTPRQAKIGLFRSLEASDAEKRSPRAGDEIVTTAAVTMDRSFTVPGPPSETMRWLVQLGKGRAGWYLPQGIERFLPPSHRAIRHLDPTWQEPRVGDVIPDYGGRHETFTVAQYTPHSSLVYESWRGATHVSWAMTVTPLDGADETRVHLRLRLGPVKHRRLVVTLGELLDLLTVAGMAAGLRERIQKGAAGR